MSLKKSKWHYPFKLTKINYSSPHEIVEEYQPITLHKHNQYRRQFLPTFPNLIHQSVDQAPLLLANVPKQKLSNFELTRRSFGAYPDPFNIDLKNTVPSYIYSTYENLLSNLSERLHVDKVILDYNLYRLHHIIHVFQSKYRSYERSNLLFDHHFQLPVHEQQMRMFNQNELIILLEFFLQIDVDLFFMKAYEFPHDNQTLVKNQLFALDDISHGCYDMKPCQRFFCSLCRSIENEPSSQPSVTFSNEGQKHRFCNGYEAILNCSANCQTNNIVYVLTCICGEYDYISSTQYTLNDILDYHRQHTNRLIIEHLLNGEPFSNFCTCSNNQLDRKRTNRMRLYQHFVHCSKVLQLFLENNPIYWCFIPMKIEQAQFDDLSYLSTLSSINTTNDDKQTNTMIDHCLANIPKSPIGYQFSKRQHDEQRHFFQMFNPEQYCSHSIIDFYHATIVAVLPKSCSMMLRQMIEILFVTHAETKLNSINLLTGDNNLLYGLPFHQDRIWCEHLICPSFNHQQVSTTNLSTFLQYE